MDEIEELLTRSVDKIYPSREALESLLRSSKKLRLYQGFDPTGAQLHIGHAIGLRKMRQFQNLGHEVIFLIGDFTGMIGDPTGKLSERKQLTRDEVLRNAESYKSQAGRILRFSGENAVKIIYNSEWLGNMSAIEFFRLAHYLTYAQIIERDMFQDRLKQGQDVYMNEFLYPFMQAYDSVALDVDLEIGGSDQTFNMLMGRKLMRNIKKKEKFVLTTPLLVDSRGNKIGKTEGNIIGITDPPGEFYGKIMSLGDNTIIPCFQLLTDTSEEKIDRIKNEISKGTNPMEFKKKLAFELTKQFNDEKTAQIAQREFEIRFEKGNLDQADLPKISAAEFVKGMTIIEALINSGIAFSNSEARRLVEQQAVKVNDKLVTSGKKVLDYKPGDVIKVGRRAMRIVK